MLLKKCASSMSVHNRNTFSPYFGKKQTNKQKPNLSVRPNNLNKFKNNRPPCL